MVIKKILDNAVQQVLAQVTVVVQETISNYLSDLEQHIGKIPGTGSSDLNWEPLDPDTEAGHTFWYKTGNVARHIIANVTVSNGRVHAFAGLPSDAPGYQEAIWNEFGWTPHGSHKVVRRALFIPLAEYHLRELNEILSTKFSNIPVNIRIKL